MDIVISDPDTLFLEKMKDYAEGVITNRASRRWPRVVGIGKNLIEKYQKLKGDLAWYIRWFTTIGTLYTEVQVEVTAQRCCCCSKTSKSRKGSTYPRSGCIATEIQGKSSKRIFMDLKLLIGYSVSDSRKFEMEVNRVINTVKFAMRGAVKSLIASKKCE